MPLILHFENASSEAAVPDEADVHRWSSLALKQQNKNFELCIRLVSEQESADLNRTYRGKDNPTNVLSFPAQLPDDIDSPLLGDLAICASVVNREAQQQGKPSAAHWAHMIIHGCLHLLGYDHIEPQQADAMEQLEIQLLEQLDFPNPYLITTTDNHGALP